MKTLQDWEKEKGDISVVLNKATARFKTEKQQLYKQIATKPDIISLTNILEMLKSVKATLADFGELTEANLVSERNQLFQQYQTLLIHLQIILCEKFISYKYKLSTLDDLHDQTKRYNASAERSDVELLKKASLNLINAWEAMHGDNNALDPVELRSYSKKCASLQLELDVLANVSLQDILILKQYLTDSASQSELLKVREAKNPQLWTKQLEAILKKLNNAEANFYFRWQETVIRFRQYFNKFILKQNSSNPKGVNNYLIATFLPEFAHALNQYECLIATIQGNQSLKPKLVTISADINAFFYSILCIGSNVKKFPVASFQPFFDFLEKLLQLMEMIEKIDSNFAIQTLLLKEDGNVFRQRLSQVFVKNPKKASSESEEEGMLDNIAELWETFTDKYSDMRNGIALSDELSPAEKIQENNLSLAEIKANLIVAMTDKNTNEMLKYYLLIGDYFLKKAYRRHDLDTKISNFTEAKKSYGIAINNVAAPDSSYHRLLSKAIEKVDEELKSLRVRKEDELARLNKGRDEAKKRIDISTAIFKQNFTEKERQFSANILEQVLTILGMGAENKQAPNAIKEVANKQSSDVKPTEPAVVITEPATTKRKRRRRKTDKQSTASAAQSVTASETQAAQAAILPLASEKPDDAKNNTTEEQVEKQSQQPVSIQPAIPNQIQITVEADQPVTSPSLTSEMLHKTKSNATEEKQAQPASAQPAILGPEQVAVKANNNETAEKKIEKQSTLPVASPPAKPSYAQIVARLAANERKKTLPPATANLASSANKRTAVLQPVIQKTVSNHRFHRSETPRKSTTNGKSLNSNWFKI